MKKKEISINYTLYENLEELVDPFFKLIKKAKQASELAYAPYSNFKVGVAILLENNEILQANNQENAAFPSGLCAERVALFYKGANYPDIRIKAMGIYAPKKSIISPCGSCRQVMIESEKRNSSKIKLFLSCDSSEVAEFESFIDILPFPFTEF